MILKNNTLILILSIIVVGALAVYMTEKTPDTDQESSTETSASSLNAVDFSATTTPEDVRIPARGEGEVVSGEEDSEVASVTGPTPQELVGMYLERIRAGEIEMAHELNLASKQGIDSSGLREVVENYGLDTNTGFELHSAITTATSSELRGVIEAEGEKTIDFLANFSIYNGEWIISQLFVFRDSAPKNVAPVSKEEAELLVANIAMLLAQAIESDDYTDAYEAFAPVFRESVSEKKFTDAYENLTDSEQEQVVTAITKYSGLVSSTPTIDESGYMHLTYSYSSAPKPISIDMAFADVDGEWQPVQANLR